MRGLFGALAGAERKSTVLDWIPEFLRYPDSKSGVMVNWKTALDVTTVLACGRVVSEGTAQVPLKLHRTRADGRGSDLATDHSLYIVLHRRPNTWQTSFEFRETLCFHLLLCGNAFAFINRVGDGRIKELIPIEPGRVEVFRAKDFSLSYRVTAEDGSQQTFPQEAIWHLRGPSWDSWRGLEAVKLAREAIGLAISTEASQALLHKNGAQAGGVVSVEPALGPERYSQLEAWIDAKITGPNKHKPLLLDNGAKWFQTSLSSVDAQHLETRKHQVEEICRAFRVMPIMVGLADKTATYASAEQMFLAHVVHTLGPWYQRIEQSGDVNLLTAREREQGYFIKHNVNALLRGAFKDRTDGYAKALGAGGAPAWLTPNDIRELEDMNPVKGGDELPKPTNVAPPAKKPGAEEPDIDNEGDPDGKA
jgi:HK97 family phage portal protein